MSISRKNIKGFTLIELLAILILLGILLLIAFPIVNSFVKEAKEKVCKLDAKMMEKAASNYIDSNFINIKYGEKKIVTLKELQNSGFISAMYSPYAKKTACTGYVVVTNTGEVNDYYSFQSELKCSDSCTTANYDIAYDDTGSTGPNENHQETSVDDIKDDMAVKNNDWYYEGANPKNWVLFGRSDVTNSSSAILWRIVKIDDTGIKMVYEGNRNGEKNPLEDGRALIDGTMGIAWNSSGINKWDETTSLVGKLDSFLSRINVINVNNYIEKTAWKIGGVPYQNPTLLRTFVEYQAIDSVNTGGNFFGYTKYKKAIGTINAVDFLYTSDNKSCSSSYLETGSTNECAYNPDNGNINNFLQKNKYMYWTLNARSDSKNMVWDITNSGLLGSTMSNLTATSVRPVLNIKLSTKFISGDGSITDPYILEEYMLNVTKAPEIAIVGDNPKYVYQGDTYSDAGATAVDETDGDLSSSISTTSNVDTSKLGTYEVTYNVTDSDGNKAIPQVRKVVVIKKDAPIITLNGSNPTYVIINSAYSELGATAKDPNYGDLSSDIIISGNVDTSTLGSYYIKYNVKNKDGVSAPEVERTVIVKASVPKITLNGNQLTLVDIGTNYVEEGATATDDAFGDISYKIEKSIQKYDKEDEKWIDVASIDTSELDTYKIKYSVTNDFGSNAYTYRTVKIVGVDGPIITFDKDGNDTSQKTYSTVISIYKNKHDIDVKTQKYILLNTKQNLNFKTPEELDKIFKNTYSNNSTLNIYSGTGYYYFYATAKDIYKDTTYKKSKTFKIDNSKPVVRLNAGANRILIGKTYIDPGATAYDEYFDGNLTNKIQVENKVNTTNAGIYNITYTATDSAGNVGTATRKVEVYTPTPKISLLGGSSIRIRYGLEFVEPGYTATDEVDGDITDKVKVTGSVNTSKEGIYSLTYTVTNSSGIEAKVVRNVEVYVPSPKITIIGSNPYKLLIDSVYSDEGATATDEIDGDITNKISIVSNVDTTKEGKYKVTYSVTNSLGKTTTLDRVVDVYIPLPVITILGENPIILYKGQQYTDLGATATDEIDGDVSDSITFTSNIDVNKEGTYKVTYKATNSRGKEATADRNVIVRKSITKIELIGGAAVTILRGTPYTEAGFTATDEVDGDVTSKVVVDLGNLNVNVAGNYTIKYSYTNSGGDITTVVRQVKVRKPELIIKVKGEESVTILRGTSYTDLGATAIDEIDGDISDNITINLNNFNPNLAGTYKIIYSITNSGGDRATAERTVIVRKPLLTINILGDSSYEMIRGQTYTDQGAIATDEIDGDISDNITIDLGNFNPNIVGTYKIKYSITNSGGDTETAERTVVVRKPNLIVTLTGSKTIQVLRGDVYRDLGATATDEIDGDITNRITIELGGLNTNQNGNYTITYRVKNSGGDEATATRTVVVKDPKIELTLLGDDPVELPIGSQYVDAGYKASDELLGDVTDKVTLTTNLNPNVLGNYTVTYSVTSSDITVTKTRQVNVIALPGPYITFNKNGNSVYAKDYTTIVTVTKNQYDVDNNSLYYQWTKTLTKPTEDSFQTKFTSGDSISTPSGGTGKYYLWIIAKDTYGNVSELASNGFNVDNIAPVLILKGDTVKEQPVDGVYKDPGVTVIENDSGLNENGVVITSNIVSGIIGKYTVVYNATDKAGNKAETITRTVSVIEASLKDSPDDENYQKKYDASYFVSANPNNWVVFGNAAENEYDYIPIYWRIIKADDMGIKIIYEGTLNSDKTSIKENGTIGSYVFDTVNNNWNRPADIKGTLYDFYANLKDDDKENLVYPINWCVGKTNSPYNIENFKNSECSTLGTEKSAIGLASGMDYLLTTTSACGGYNQGSCGIDNFLHKEYSYYTISSDSSSMESVFTANSNGGLTRTNITYKNEIRPVLNLRPDVLILGGEGTLEEPYKLNTRKATIDNDPPKIAFSPQTADGQIKDNSIEVVVTDDLSGVNNSSLKYLWTTSNSQPLESAITNSFTNGDRIAVPGDTNIYYLWVLAEDNKGNKIISKGGPYLLDNTPPVITLNGKDVVRVMQNTTYKDLGVTISDNITKTENLKLKVLTDLDITKLGKYTISYVVEDEAGNKSPTIVRQVIVGEYYPVPDGWIPVSTPEDLNDMRLDLTGKYFVVKDIDLANTEYANWTPIDNFAGSLDGNGHKIFGLNVNMSSNNVGLFSNINSSNVELKNLELYNVKIKGNDYTGALVGNLNGSNIKVSAIKVSGTINGNSYVGALIGNVQNTTIDYCVSSASISASGNYVGGIIGVATNSNINMCYSTGDVKGNVYVGGLVGYAQNGTVVTKSFASGNVESTSTSSSYVGGLLGRSNGTVSNVYALGSITAKTNSYVGGLIGYNYGTVANAYSIGTITGVSVSGSVGPIMGYSRTTPSGMYWVVQTSGIYSSNVSATKISVLADATKVSTYTSFDFTNTWDIIAGETTPYIKGMLLTEKNYVNSMVPYKWDGSGSKDDPYLIKSPKDLHSVRLVPNAYYKLANDIDLTGTDYSQWLSIENFAGGLDGNGHKIIGLNISGSSDNVGLFNAISFSEVEIKNLELYNVNITGNSNVGALIGSVTVPGIKVTAVKISGSVKGTTNIGSLIGNDQGSNITMCIGSANVTSTGNDAGGLVGISTNTNINMSYATGDVKGSVYVGGLVGYAQNGTVVTKSFASGNVESTSTSSSYVGGLLGRSNGAISNVYALGNITAKTNSYVGGLIGYNYGTVANAYSIGKITGVSVSGNTGPIMGYSRTTPSGIYWVVQTSGIYSSNIAATKISILADATKAATYTSFDFTNTWDIIAGETTPYIKGMMLTDKNYVNSMVPYKWDGSGSEINPYLIKTPQDLDAIRLVPNAYFKLNNDIDLAGTNYASWVPIDNFAGGLDGAGHKIMGLNISGMDNVGLFSIISYANVQLKNIELYNVNISGKNNVGALIGSTVPGSSSKISAIKVSGTVTGTSGVGSLVGNDQGSNINMCIGAAKITSTGNNTGGLVGVTLNTIINMSYVTGDVTGNAYVGGLIGYAQGTSVISKSFTSSNVESINTSSSYTGGLVGRSNGTINDCYMLGNVAAKSSYVGGLVGYNYGTITNSYNIGKITGVSISSNVDVLLGYTRTTPSGLYWVVSSSGIYSSNVSATKISIISNASKAATYLAFDFTNTWDIINGETTPYIKGMMLTNGNYIGSMMPYKWDGEGTIANPFLIKTPKDLDAIRLVPNAYFKLSNDIDLSVQGFDSWVPIDNFSGGLDGAGFKIKNMKITGTSDEVGLFSTISSSNVEIKNLEIYNASIAGGTNAGVVAGSVSGTGFILSGVKTSGTIIGTSNVGGLVGNLTGGNINYSISTVSINATSSYIGGLVGLTNGTNINMSYATGNIKGVSYVGGLVGNATGSTSSITKSFASGNVESTTTSSSYTGGLVGRAYGTISDCYTLGNITAKSTSYVGGVIGYNNSNVTNVYSIGSITGVTVGGSVGPIIGAHSGTASNIYWVVQTSGIYSSNIPATKIDLLGDATKAVTYSTFNFTNTWDIIDGDTTPYIKGMMATEKNYVNSMVPYDWDGSGSSADPYLVKTADDLNGIRLVPNAYYKLANDIDLRTSSYTAWTPIDDFSGSLDGDGHKIIGLNINSSTLDNAGLFSSITKDNAEVKNLDLYNVNIVGKTNVGAVVGQVTGAGFKITGVKVSGTVNGTTYVGGLVGNLTGGNINYSISTVSINATSSYIGGLVGQSNGSNITMSYATGNVKGATFVGGLVGNATGSTNSITKSFTSGNVESTSTSTSYTGGLVGRSYGTVSNCYTLGNITARYNSYVGGVIGNNYGTVTNVYSIGSIIGIPLNSAAGPIIGTQSGTASNIYWVVQTSGIYSSNISATKIDLLGNATKAATYSSFDFANTWDIIDGETTPYIKGMMAIEKNYVNSMVPYEWDGAGSSADPYLVKTADDLNGIRLVPNAYYKLANDIDLRTSSYTAWTPIDDFSGSLDGDGHKIIGLNINSSTLDNAGLFSSITKDNAEVKNLDLYNVNIVGRSYVGAVVGQVTGAGFKITGVKVSGTINGTTYVGGLVGNLTGGVINLSLSSATVVSSSTYVGGLLGYLNGTAITMSYATGNVKGNSYVGGLVGYAYATTSSITKSFASGNVESTNTSSSYTGGLVGRSYATVSNCYTLGNITARYATAVGGVIGNNYGTVTNVYSIGSITGVPLNSAAGPIIGTQSGTASNIYWVVQTSGIYSSNISATKIDLLGNATKAATYSSFDFANTWDIINGQTTPYIKGMMLNEKNYVSSMVPYTWSGSGTKDNPYLIKTPNDLNAIRLVPNACYQLFNDIDLTGSSYAIWSPIDDFSGSLDGDGHKISGLNINSSTLDNLGLFSSITKENAEVKNLDLYNVNIVGRSNVGSIVGQVTGAGFNITGVKASGTITGASNIGGLVGNITGGIIDSSASSVTINATSTYIGGLAGLTNNTTITRSYTTGNSKGNSYVGGLVGYAQGTSSSITKSFTSGNVESTNTSSSYTGGLVGRVYGTISNCYTLSNVTAKYSTYVGGIAGANYATITYTYSAGTMSGVTYNSNLGPIVGVQNGTLSNSYFDKETYGISSVNYGEGKTTIEMQTDSSYVNWDFTNTWVITGTTYPRLKEIKY